MTFRQTADASGEYHVRTGVNIARLDSSSQCGNLADVTKNSTVIVPTITIIQVHLSRRLTSGSRRLCRDSKAAPPRHSALGRLPDTGRSITSATQARPARSQPFPFAAYCARAALTAPDLKSALVTHGGPLADSTIALQQGP
jgi:hypothetical protein